jgi:Domain of unknown function (DUF3883)
MMLSSNLILHRACLNTISYTSHQSSTFLSCYFGSTAIISYLDVERDLVTVLRSFSLPSLKSLYDQQQIAACNQQIKDPHEIDIDDLQEAANEAVRENLSAQEPAVAAPSFLDYGIGPLYHFPSVSHYFPQLLQNNSTENFVGSTVILRSLASCLKDISCATVEKLEAFVCKDLEVSKLSDIGVNITGNLKLELTMIGHVHAARVKLIVELNRLYLKRFNDSENETNQAYELTARNRRQREREQVEAYSHILSEPLSGSIRPSNTISSGDHFKRKGVPSVVTTRGAVTSFVDRCSAILADSPYSPSFQKVLKAVELISEGSGAVTSEGKRKKKRKRNKEWEPSESYGKKQLDFEEVEDIDWSEKNVPGNDIKSLQEVAAEYVMLHLGGEKYRVKHIIDECKAEGIVEDENSVENNVEKKCSREDSVVGVSDIQGDEVVPVHSGDPRSIDNDDDDNASSACSGKKAEPLEGTTEPVNPGPALPEVTADATLLSESYSADVIVQSNDELGTSLSHSMDITSSDSGTCKLNLKFQEKADTSFECRLFNSSSSSTAISTTQPGNLMYTINNESIRDLVPWCGGLSGSIEENKEILDLHSIGKWGEALVYQYLMGKNPSLQVPGLASPTVEWLNEKEETRAGYDIITTVPKRVDNQGFGAGNRPSSVTETTYIEVKTSRFDNLNTFEISLWEWQFATSNPRVRYHIYRVYNAFSPSKVRIVVLEDVLELITMKKVKLCLNI